MASTMYYQKTFNEVFAELKTKHQGLSEAEVARRRGVYGANKLPEQKPPSALFIFLAQFKNVLIYILLIAAAINFSLVCGKYDRLIFEIAAQADTYIILVAVLINVVVGFVQEQRAQKSLEALKKIITLQARVWRQGKQQLILAEDLVPGDIIWVMAGDRIPADGRLFEVEEAAANESALTGESAPINKQIEKLGEQLTIGDQKNMIFTGTTIVKGQAKAVVTAIGSETEIGKIAKLIKETKDEETPLQQKLGKFSKNIGLLIVFIALALLGVGYWQGDELVEIFTVAVAVAVSALPEGLAVAVTVILALGMQRILKQKALVRKLVAAETLGSTTVICTDKTGTLTEGKMQVTDLVTWDHDFAAQHIDHNGREELIDEELMFALKIGLLCNDAYISNPEEKIEKWTVAGNLTERALLMAAVQAGLDWTKERKQYPRLDSLPFDSEIKYMATLNRYQATENIVYFKGAPEKVLERCTKLRIGKSEEKLTEQRRQKFKNKFIALSHKGLRVLALAYVIVKKEKTKLKDIDLQELVFVGYVGIKDPLRPSSKETIKLCQAAGIKVVMITGDHKLTAQAIAKDLDLPAKEDNILEGMALSKMSDSELVRKVEKIHVYARVSPEDKLRIVKAWRAKGEVVAMTGDGINDSPALKAADIGVALGSGTQVAKETSEMVILDDNFGSIVKAVEEGRGIFDNIKKTVLYLVSDSFSEVLLVAGSMVMGLPLPMTAAQILWINLVNDTLPNLALTKEPKEKEIMQEPPRGRQAQILDKEVKTLTAIISIVTGLANMLLFYFYYTFTDDVVLARTVVFAALGIDSLFYVFSVRTLRHSIFKYNLFSNPYLLGAIIISAGFLLAALYLPFLQELIRTKPLAIIDWLVVLAMSGLVILNIEIVKFIFLRWSKKNNK